MNKKKILAISIVSILIIALITSNIILNLDGGKKEEATATKITTQDIIYNIECTGVLKESKSKSVYLDGTVPIKKINVKKYDYVKKGDTLAIMDTSSIETTYETQVIDTAATKKAQKAAAKAAAKAATAQQQTQQQAQQAAQQQVTPTSYEATAASQSMDMSQYQSATSTATNTNANVVYKTVTKVNKDAVKRKNKIIALTKAPMSGIIAAINVVENGYANTMTASFVIINTDKMEVTANIKESDISKISIGMPVEITGDSIPTDRKVTGKVTSIAPMASTTQGMTGSETSIEATIKINGNSKGLLPNSNVTCTITVDSKKDVTVVGFNMLKEDKDGNKSVFVIDEITGELTETPVKLGLVADVNVEVIEGVKPGQIVCASPLAYYKSGMKVNYTLTEE